MKYLNIAAAVIVVAILSQSRGWHAAPPEDPWFQRVIVQYPRPVLVKFGAEWCPPCRHLEGILDQAEGRLRGQVKIVRIDVDEKPELARHYGISGIPRVLLFEEGKIVATHGGFGDIDQLISWVDRYARPKASR